MVPFLIGSAMECDPKEADKKLKTCTKTELYVIFLIPVGLSII